MEHILEYSEWTSTSTVSGDPEIDWSYISKDKTYYGVHTVYLIKDNKRIPVKAKFDTGARTTSIDLSVAEKLGIGQELIDAYRELEKIEVPKGISKKEQDQMEKDLSKEYSEKYPDITSVQISKSASGFSIRPYVRLTIELNGRYVTTQANLKDRSGMSCEMLIGLGDML
jgi:hypothetical protein